MSDTAILSVSSTKTVYSFSRLKLFEDCHRSYHYKYNEKKPSPSGPLAKSGKIFHLAMSLVIKEGYAPDEATFYSIFQEDGLPEGERDFYIIAMINKAYKRIKELHEYVDIFSEQHIIVTTEDGHQIQAYLDAIIDDPIYDVLEIWDFKTSWVPYSAKTSKQLPLYAYLVKQMRKGVIASKFVGKLIFPRFSLEQDSEVTFTEELINEADQWAKDLINKIESRNSKNVDEWEKTADTKKCEYCPFSTLCAAGYLHYLPGDGQPKDQEEAEKLGEYIFRFEQAIKQMKKGLNQYVKKNGKVPIEGGYWDIVPSSPNPSISDNILAQYAEEHGKSLLEAYKQDPAVIKAWIEEDNTGYLSANSEWSKPRNSFKAVSVESEK